MEGGESDAERTSNENYEENPLPELTVASNRRFLFPITIEPIVFFLFLADTITDSVIPNLILTRTCLIHFHFNKSVCNQLAHPLKNMSILEEEVQKYSVVILTGMNFFSKLFPAVLSLFLGPWSDYNGRKLILVVPALGYIIQYLSLAVLTFLPDLGPEYGLLVVIPVALTGGLTNFITGVYSYISDISKEENRSFRISLIESVMYSSVYVGLLSSSYLLKVGGAYGYLLIFGLSAFLLSISTLPTFLFLPESVAVTERGGGLLKIFDLKLLREVFRVFFKKREGDRRAVILLATATLTITIGIGAGEANVYYLYAKLRFGWDIQDFTLWSSVLLASSFIGLLVGSAVFTKWLKIPDCILGLISFIFKAASLFFIGLIPSNAPYLMFYAGFFVVLNGLSGPLGRAILSKSVPKEDLGKVFAVVGAAEAISPLACGPLFTILYNCTISTAPSAFLFVSGGLFVLSAVFFGIIYFLQKENKRTEFERLVNETEN